MVLVHSIALAAMLTCLALNGAAAFEPPLSDSEVTRVRDASRDMADVIKQHQSEFESLGHQHGARVQEGADPCAVPPAAKSGPGFQKMLAIARKNGFSTGEDYCRSSMRVMAACGAVRAQREDPNWRQTMSQSGPASEQARAQMEFARQQIEANPDLSPEQKAQMLAKMSEAMDSLAGARSSPILALMDDVSPQDMRTAAPACAEIERVYDIRGAAGRG